MKKFIQIKPNQIFEENSKQKGKKVVNLTKKQHKRKIRNFLHYDPSQYIPLLI